MRFGYNIQENRTIIRTGCDVQKNQLIGAFFVVTFGNLNRMAGVLQIKKLGAFHDTAAVHIQARDDAAGEH
jgi:hypothetical protein